VKIIPSKTFVRDAKRFQKKNPHFAKNVKITLNLLEADTFHPQLKTHKLKGSLKNCWACSVGYDLRIVFEIVRYENEDAILLQAIGTHDEVY
jgi:addiction module RelE/StbE family toxin